MKLDKGSRDGAVVPNHFWVEKPILTVVETFGDEWIEGSVSWANTSILPYLLGERLVNAVCDNN